MNRLTRTTVALAAAAVAVAGLSGTALANVHATATASDSPSPDPTGGKLGPQSLQAVQAKAAAAIAKRVASLNKVITAVTSNTHLTAGDKSALLSTLNGDLSGLTALGATIAADTTTQQAVTDYKTIFTNYRVYALALPQVHFVTAADTLNGMVVPKLTAVQAKLVARLAADPSKNTPTVQAAMADLAAKITDIGTSTSGLAATVLAYTPAQYNADHTLLASVRTTLKAGRTDIKAARADIMTVRSALK